VYISQKLTNYWLLFINLSPTTEYGRRTQTTRMAG